MVALLIVIASRPEAMAQPAPAGPESVVVVANAEMKGSLRVARYYMKARDIPEKNLIVLKTETIERISRQAYLDTIHNPLLEAFQQAGLLDAYKGSRDAFGRDTVTVFSNSVRYLVLCYGIPAHVTGPPPAETDDTSLLKKQLKGRYLNLVGSFQEGRMAKTEASVDGELSLLLKRDVPLRGFLPNPLHQDPTQGKGKDILRVTRLDGPSPEAVMRMVDNALAGERNGLKGRAYVDEDGRGGGFAVGNQWMAGCAELFKKMGYDLEHNTVRSTFRASDRFDAPVLYAGWYSHNRNGPFALSGWQFPEGAVAAHLHSFSARPIRSTSKGWVGPLIDKGVSATFGNVAEPYLSLTHQFDAFFAALANGWNLGDAAYFALPGLSWQGVAFGDPLYRPFAVGLEEQFKQIGDPLNILEDQYVVMRQVRMLQAQEKPEAAMALAERGMRETPGPALALLLAKLHQAEGNKRTARKTLSLFSQLPPATSNEWGLYADIADTLRELGDPEAALMIYQKLESQKMPEKVQLAFLKRGIKSAEKAGEAGIAIDWRTRTTPPPPPPPEKTPEPKTQKP
jgi:uncharacterized protein (TIGR03790 family)